MRINGVSPNIPITNREPVQSNQPKNDVNKVSKDKIEISQEAKVLNESGLNPKLTEIKQKIESGFYNSEEVVSKVADKIYKEIG